LRRPSDSAPDSGFRGLFLTADAIDGILAGRPVLPDTGADRVAELEAAADALEAGGTTLRLRRLARSFELTDLDVEILLTAVAPDLDARFEQLFGYLNDDVSQRRATPRLVLDLLAIPPADPVARARFDSNAPLFAGGLLDTDGSTRPFLSRPLRVPDQVTAYLVGGSATEPVLLDLVVPPPLAVDGEIDRLVRVLKPGNPVYLKEKPGSAAKGLAAAALAKLGLGVLSLDLTRLPKDVDPVGFVRTTARQARLRSAGILAGPVESLTGDRVAVLRALSIAPVPVILTGLPTWDPAWSPVVPAVLDAPALTRAESNVLWKTLLPEASTEADLDPASETSTFRLDVDQIARTVEAAVTHAALEPDRRTVPGSNGWPVASSRQCRGTTSSCRPNNSDDCRNSRPGHGIANR
jgi:hypothetical protein